VTERSPILRRLPRVDEVLAAPPMARAAAGLPRSLARAAARQAIEEAREQALAGNDSLDTSIEATAARAAEILGHKHRRSLRRAINATGVILHTGLGRAPLPEPARRALAEAASGYSNLQADVGSGERMPREAHVEPLLREITGAEAAVVVNNNAAATVLALNTLAAGREVVVSRGEMVEIGGAFRLPDIIALSGCQLVEVGCTNRTHLRDYRNAISANTALLLSVHQSNYRILGFASQVPIAEIAALAHERGLLCAHDLGSGALLDLRHFGLPAEPTATASLKAQADVVFFSGDKLLGGPQCGIVLGRAALLETMRGNPYYRTFRVGKLTLSALEATLRLFLDLAHLPESHPVMAMLTSPLEQIRQRAQALAERVRQACGEWLEASVVEGQSQVGGGSLAGHSLPSVVVRLSSAELAAHEIASRLRLSDPPVFTRVHQDAVHIDLRTVLADESDLIIAALERLRLSSHQ